MAATRILSVIGKPRSGKSTLITALAAEYGRKGYRVVHVTPDPSSPDPVGEAIRAGAGADMILVEGAEAAHLPKIEVFRVESAPRPIFAAHLPNAREWIALVTDDDRLDAACPVLRFRDTMWLQLVANMAWEKAKVL